MGKDQELLDAARSGNAAVVEKILGQRAKRSGPLASLRRGPGANVQDSSGYSSLHHAALNGHKEIVRLLLDHDASTNIVDSKGSSPLHLAAWSGNVDIVELLLTGHSICNVNLTTKDDETALHCAAQYGHTAVVGLLLEHGCDPRIRNSRGETALDLAAQYGRIDTVELLVRSHPGLIQPMQRVVPGTVFPHTPLHLASRNGHKTVVEILLRSGMDVNIRSPAGTALHEAALCGKVEVVRTLLEHGIDTNLRDAHNYTVKDVLNQLPPQATQEIMGLLRRHRKYRNSHHHMVESDAESFSQPFPLVPSTDSDLGSPYENVRPSSRGRSATTDPSPGSSPHRWDFHRQARSVDGVEDRRISGTSMRTNPVFQSLPPSNRLKKSSKAAKQRRQSSSTKSNGTNSNSSANSNTNSNSPWDSVTFNFSRLLHNQTSSLSQSLYTIIDAAEEKDLPNNESNNNKINMKKHHQRNYSTSSINPHLFLSSTNLLNYEKKSKNLSLSAHSLNVTQVLFDAKKERESFNQSIPSSTSSASRKSSDSGSISSYHSAESNLIQNVQNADFSSLPLTTDGQNGYEVMNSPSSKPPPSVHRCINNDNKVIEEGKESKKSVGVLPSPPPIPSRAHLPINGLLPSLTRLSSRLSNSPSSCISSSSSSYRSATDEFCRESENLLFFPAPKQFMDSSVHSEDLYPYNHREIDQLSMSSTASSCGYNRRPDSAGAPLYMPMTRGSGGGHSPGSNHSKVSPTPPKKPPRRNLSVSPTHLQPMSMSADGFSNNAYEYMFLAHSGTRSQGNLADIDHETRRERLVHGRSVDQYVEMNTVFNINLDEEDDRLPQPQQQNLNQKELQRGKSEDLDSRRPPPPLLQNREPVAITSMYENMIVKQQNPRRKLRRNPDYEEYEFPHQQQQQQKINSSYVSNAYIMVNDYSSEEDKGNGNGNNGSSSSSSGGKFVTPLSPTNYQQPPTPEHPPPSALQAENFIHERIRPLSQEYKRRSKDMETEIEEEYLLVCDESSSISSSVSLSDRSVDNIVEEYRSDAPFAGLFKGSTKVLDCLSNKPIPAERPKTLKKLRRVYDSNGDSQNLSKESSTSNQQTNSNNSNSSSSEKESSSDNKENKENNKENNKDRVSALSPFDEQEEWAKIQEIMASFGTGVVRESVFVSELEKEFQNRLMSLSGPKNCSSSSSSGNTEICDVEKWLQSLEMGDYSQIFITNGYDDIEFLNGVLEENDLKEIGVHSEIDRQIILDALKNLPFKVAYNSAYNNNVNEAETVPNWLRRIKLEQYAETFAKHLYHDMERIKRIWDVELSAVLDIEKLGHRKRILASVSSGEHITAGPKLEEISADLNILKNNIQQIKSEMKSPSTHSANSNASNTGTIRHRHKKSRPAPPPPVSNNGQKSAEEEKKEKTSELSVGGSNSIKAQWRHQPILLITGAVKYTVNYLGSTVIKEFKGTESTKKSIQKIRKGKEYNEQEIVLAISYRGLKYVNADTQETICEHEIRNVNSACQDPECRSFFAYITKDGNDHYCHVFSSSSSEQATDIILTLGQAFELAYQMALREQVTGKNKTKDRSAISPGSSTSSKDSQITRSNDLKMNGHPLRMKPLTLSIASEPAPSTTTTNESTQQQQQEKGQKTPTKVTFTEFDA